MKTKKLYVAAIIFGSLTASAQSVGIGTPNPAASSILELNSTNKGFLMPRMTTANRTAIAAPATGLQVFDITTNTFWHFNGTVWVNDGTGAGDNLGNHLATQTLVLNNNQLRLGAAADGNHKLSYSPGIDGPLLTGYAGGALGTEQDGTSLTALAWDSAGNVNISNKLQVTGASTNTVAYNAGAGTAINFALSNLAYTTASAGAFTLTNIKDGGTYSLSVRGTTVGTSSFTAAGFTVKYANNRPSVAATETIYTFVVMGTVVYVYTSTGF
jgi:hypothetical protein